MKTTTETSRSGWRTTGGVVLFILWSVTMVLVGSALSEFRFAESHAAESASLVKLDRERLGGDKLGTFEPYEPEHSNFDARGHTFFTSADGQFGLGVWEAKPGTLNIPEPYTVDELMYVLSGKIVLTDAQGNSEEYGPGEGVVVPKGWSGTFAVPEGVRKIWVSYQGK